MSSAAAQTTGRAQVIDGDTLEVAGQRFDLYGIDAPELGQSCQSKRNRDYDCGQLALEGLVNLTGKSPVLCRPVKGAANPTGAIWARCVVGWADVGEEQVLKGQALADPDTGGEYKRAEQAARTLNEGIWKGRFIEPWKWRQGERLEPGA